VPNSSLVGFDKLEGRLDEQNFHKIPLGMPKEEVIKILGRPRDESDASTEFPKIRYFHGFLEASIWKNDRVRIIITFDKKNRVDWKKLDNAVNDQPELQYRPSGEPEKGASCPSEIIRIRILGRRLRCLR
jgi:outer membrane protein assembly factor BamE (lipoprotein component of BamABCDE complex)